MLDSMTQTIGIVVFPGVEELDFVDPITASPARLNST
jgi:hypothetical protein